MRLYGGAIRSKIGRVIEFEFEADDDATEGDIAAEAREAVRDAISNEIGGVAEFEFKEDEDETEDDIGADAREATFDRLDFSYSEVICSRQVE